ncbi:hypothetical protein DFP94_103163 [Fontibacillus phaseoli]|uniref:Lipoprotein n=1 Tax=Fontibacillus phaseoli TaxID=1416533 RepID=A0A369BIM9_9BACL|nr:hypothetical protein [Fontibacillus phaseoli]RCX20438.1 hypothetical protein DFP94_103163 [Fontibacillus phaseoli]
MKKKGTILSYGILILLAILLQGCGQDKQVSGGAGSFAEAAGSLTQSTASAGMVESVEGTEVTGADDQIKASNGTIESNESNGNSTSIGSGETETSQESAKGEKAVKPEKGQEIKESGESASSMPQTKQFTEMKTAPGTKSGSEAKPKTAESQKPDKTSSSANVEKGKSELKTKEASGNAAGASSGKTEAKVAASASGDAKTEAKEKTIQSIGWSQFFDGEDQTTPSESFWDLSGSTVTIKGFMGEVLSFENNWFLLIPEPGAECPFDNGDETYWNKIMIVFVPEDVKLRYKSEPLEITGRLDVGIKIDESGYKTMFRLYDASFKEIKE